MKRKEDNDDITIDGNDDGEDSFADVDCQKKLKKVKAELKACQKERQDYLNGWQRAKADYVNLKKELDESVANSSQRAKLKIVSEFLPAIDNFRLAFQDKEAWQKTPENWRLGIEHIYNQLHQTLQNLGVTEINEINITFDPNIHEALETVPVDKKEQDDVVIEVVRPGYKMKDKIIRPAQVKVGNFKN